MSKKLLSLPARPEAGDIDCSGDPPLTKQEFAEESDINVIVARCLRGDGVSSFASQAGVFADVTGIGDFADCLRRIDAAREAFLELPAEVRSRFGNRPEGLVEFLQDPANLKEALKLGLVVERKPPEPVAVKVVSEPAPPAPAVPPKP